MSVQDRNEEIAFFDRFTKDRDYDSLTAYGYQSIIKAFRRCLGPTWEQVRTAADLGCGTGSFTRRFFENKAANVVGIDISRQAIHRAQAKKDGIHYLVSDISKTGLKSGSMDLVIFSGVLHHFPDTGPCLREAYRILKKGGALLSYDPHIGNPGMWLYRHPRSPFCSKAGKTDNERLLSKRQMQEALQQADFTRIQIRAISGVTISYLESKTAGAFLPFYNAQEYLLGLLPVADSLGSFLICHGRK
ncbi:MAG: class I SAM-dependent methyltransferase [Candidatus Omnitrophica bacterium]|nr:class I SAM-dependent methyltransferase [Candidatus Omnitrophota bacterium]